MNLATVSGRLTGQRLIGVERSDYDWLFRFTNDASLRVPGPWRILMEGRIALGDCDHGQKFGLPEPVDGPAEAKRLLSNKSIQAVVVREDAGDLAITFSDRTVLEVFQISSGHEGWQIGIPGLNVVVMGGGDLAMWKS